MAEEKEQGEVIKVEGPLVSVRMRQHVSCEACGQRALCFPAGRYRILIARAQGSLHEGDYVTIDSAAAPAVISSLLIFVGPIILGVVVLLLGQVTNVPLWMTLVTMGIVLVAYFLFLITLNNRLKKVGWFLPRAVKSDFIQLKVSEG